ncbi:acyloxyacyl hydrolase [Cupriavidus gilardii]
MRTPESLEPPQAFRALPAFPVPVFLAAITMPFDDDPFARLSRRPSPSRQSMRALRWLVALPLLIAGTAAWADPTVQIAYGTDSRTDVRKVDIAFGWDSGYGWGDPTGLRLGLLWEVNVARWDSTSDANPRNLWEIGAQPVLRLAWQRHRWVPFLEASIGVRLMSGTRTSDNHTMSTAFQFSDMAGVGIAFGKDQRFAVGYRYQHISNAGIKKPNPGSDFHTAYLRYRF